ncbi:c-type cytochrome biogenesis protein CcsB [Viridibacillus sp. YIM B01967]|uniref:C-type cytochrome biogenesis protein CcsB n=1 Tax=Viridibacillus soli TaxID=2798301 RepID=A0ABS1HBH6_9BACL|nr:c-type cytochrome biogenesis protein CcsB [Viridibacillus soli]MBK3496338.1 c-type cytochrome biogenesis protein CcsB [Viridibacillus soli]
MQSLIDISSTALYISFLTYLIAIIPLGLSVTSQKRVFSIVGLSMTWIGFTLQITYFGIRWYAIGHAPVGNMYEFMTFFGIMLVAAFLIMYYIYHQSVIGLFALPIALLILGYANAFSKDVTPLIPALQSEWLTIHVITVAFSSAVLSISFVTSVIYLLKVINTEEKSKKTFFLELVMYFLVVVCGFIATTSAFNIAGYEKNIQFTNQDEKLEVYEYKMPAITVPKESVVVEMAEDKKVTQTTGESGFLEVSSFLNAMKLNTLIWSFLVGSLLYLLIRLITRRKIISLLKPLTNRVNAATMDEISYRSIVIGFPLFTLGGLIFAMIWAQIAWSRFWGWDPKEVWALITFLFYAAFLHLRLNKGWEGEKTAWLSIIGFGTIIFNQVFVNLVIAGLHSYA